MTPKKRMMFILSQDYYLMTYSTLLLLRSLGATSSATALTDLAKLNLLIELVSNRRLLTIVSSARERNGNLATRDTAYLGDVYHGLISRSPLLNRVIFILVHRKIVSVEKHGNKENIFILEQNVNERLFNDQVYHEELAGIARIRRIFPQIKRMTKDSLVRSTFEDNGVLAWEL